MCITIVGEVFVKIPICFLSDFGEVANIPRTAFVAELSTKSEWENAEILVRSIYSFDTSCHMFRRERTEQASRMTKYLMICLNIEKQREKSATRWSLESLYFSSLFPLNQANKTAKGNAQQKGLKHQLPGDLYISYISSFFKIRAAMFSTCPKSFRFFPSFEQSQQHPFLSLQCGSSFR